MNKRRDVHPDHDHDHDRGLAFDLSNLVSRRRLLALATGAGASVVLGACGKAASGAVTSGASDTLGTADTTAASCDPIPEETAGPFPGDGSIGPNVLTEADIVRSDIRSSIGPAGGVAEGVPLTVELILTDTAARCAPLEGAAVYVWHCDREGNYSMYSPGVEDENYLRGVQESEADGKVTFLSVFPGCYPGRWPHIHFEVYANLEDATGGGSPIATSQLAFPEDVSGVVYATAGYDQSASNLARVSLETDIVFRDDQAAMQMATLTTGTADVASTTDAVETADGYLATLTVAV